MNKLKKNTTNWDPQGKRDQKQQTDKGPKEVNMCTWGRLMREGGAGGKINKDAPERGMRLLDKSKTSGGWGEQAQQTDN